MTPSLRLIHNKEVEMTDRSMTAHEQQTIEAWEEYKAAFLKCQETLKVDDGIAAARAYRKFLDLFTKDDEGGK